MPSCCSPSPSHCPGKGETYENLIHLHLHWYKRLSMKYCLFGRIYLYRDRETARKDFKKVSANGKHPTFFSGNFRFELL